MKKQLINFSYVLVWIVVTTLFLNPISADQIMDSNLAKWFSAITSNSTKAEKNLVWLDTGWKLPEDIIPATAVWGWGGFMHQIIYYSPYQHQTCPTDYLRIINTPRTSGYGDYNVMNATRTDTPVMINYVFKDTCRHLDWTVGDSSRQRAYSDTSPYIGYCNYVTLCSKVY